jgi:hypothetical protein
MPISLASERPEVHHKGSRANFLWSLVDPWDERRLAAFLMTKHRRNDSDWTRRTSPFFAALGLAAVECSVPVGSPDSLADLEKVLTSELKGILAGASRVHDDMIRNKDWRTVTPRDIED